VHSLAVGALGRSSSPRCPVSTLLIMSLAVLVLPSRPLDRVFRLRLFSYLGLRPQGNLALRWFLRPATTSFAR
jgi:hypothetical protein